MFEFVLYVCLFFHVCVCLLFVVWGEGRLFLLVFPACMCCLFLIFALCLFVVCFLFDVFILFVVRVCL